MVLTTVPEDGDKDGATSPATGPEGLMPPRQEPKDSPPRPRLQTPEFPRLRYISTARFRIFLFWRLRVMCKHCSIYGGGGEMSCKSYHQASPHGDGACDVCFRLPAVHAAGHLCNQPAATSQTPETWSFHHHRTWGKLNCMWNSDFDASSASGHEAVSGLAQQAICALFPKDLPLALTTGLASQDAVRTRPFRRHLST